MLFFDTRLMNLYLIGFFSIAAIAVALALGAGIAEVMHYRRLHLAQAAIAPTRRAQSSLHSTSCRSGGTLRV